LLGLPQAEVPRWSGFVVAAQNNSDLKDPEKKII